MTTTEPTTETLRLRQGGALATILAITEDHTTEADMIVRIRRIAQAAMAGGAFRKAAAALALVAALLPMPARAAEVYAGDIAQYTNVGGPLAPTFTNVLLVALGFVALAVAVVLVARWAAAPDTGRPRRTRPTVTRRAETRPLAVARRIEGRE